MNTILFTEDRYEQTLIQLFQEMGYEYACGYDVERDFREPYYGADLQKALRNLNPMLSNEVLHEAYRLVTNVNEGILEQRNEQLMDYLQNGVEVKYAEGGRNKTALVRLVARCPEVRLLFSVEIFVQVQQLPLAAQEKPEGIEPRILVFALGIGRSVFMHQRRLDEQQ